MAPNGTTKNTPGLSPRQQAALPILASTPTIAHAARISKVGRRTLHRWLQDPEFQEELAKLQRQAADLAKGHLQSLTLQAALRLGEFLDDPKPEVSFRAARAVLSYSARFGEIQELQAQIQALEDSIPLWEAQEKLR